jgi:hypothetical protein
MAEGDIKAYREDADGTYYEISLEVTDVEPGTGGGGLIVGRTVTDATDNLSITDANTIILANRATAQTFTIPHTTFAVNTMIAVLQLGAGVSTIEVADTDKQDINIENKTWGANSIIYFMCIDDTVNAEVWKTIGGSV